MLMQYNIIRQYTALQHNYGSMICTITGNHCGQEASDNYWTLAIGTDHRCTLSH